VSILPFLSSATYDSTPAYQISSKVDNSSWIYNVVSSFRDGGFGVENLLPVSQLIKSKSIQRPNDDIVISPVLTSPVVCRTPLLCRRRSGDICQTLGCSRVLVRTMLLRCRCRQLCRPVTRRLCT